MKLTRLVLAVLLLFAALSVPTEAIILTCGDICTCTSNCAQTCRDDGTLQWTNCASTGDCRGGANCSL